jgi:hypothetical protein
MMSEVDETIQKGRNAIARSRGERYGGGSDRERMRQMRKIRKRNRVGRLVNIIGLGFAAILVGAILFGTVVQPLGFLGTMIVFLLLIAVLVGAFMMPAPKPPEAANLARADIAALPRQTEGWLEAQRPLLPAPAQTLIDQIGVRLDTLSPQMAGLSAQAPIASELRQLMSDQLPELVSGFRRIPKPLQNEPRHEGGTTPQQQLVDGLSLIEKQLAAASANIASGDLDRLATHQRYLELKYQGDDGSV